jgi:hypothetical protein
MTGAERTRLQQERAKVANKQRGRLSYSAAECRDLMSFSGLPREAGIVRPNMPRRMLNRLAEQGHGGHWAAHGLRPLRHPPPGRPDMISKGRIEARNRSTIAAHGVGHVVTGAQRGVITTAVIWRIAHVGDPRVYQTWNRRATLPLGLTFQAFPANDIRQLPLTPDARTAVGLPLLAVPGLFVRAFRPPATGPPA